MPAGYQLFTQQAPSLSSPTPACWTETLLTLETQVFIQDQQCMSQGSKELGSEDTQRTDGRTLPPYHGLFRFPTCPGTQMLTGISTLFHPQIKSCPLHAEMMRAPAPAAVEGSDWLARPPRTLFWRTHLKPRRHEEDEGTVPGALGDIAPVQGTHSWGRWRRHSKKEASRKRARKECSPDFPAARGAVWRCSRQGASVPTAARRADSTDSTQDGDGAGSPG